MQLIDCSLRQCVCVCACVYNQSIRLPLVVIKFHTAHSTAIQNKSVELQSHSLAHSLLHSPRTHSQTHTHSHTRTHCRNALRSGQCHCYSYCQLLLRHSAGLFTFYRGKLIEFRAGFPHSTPPASLSPSLSAYSPAVLFAALLSDFICCHNSLNTVASVNQRTAGTGAWL